MSEKKMVIMIGIQGSGKSTFYRKFLSEDYERINLDTLKTRNNEWRAIDDCIARSANFAVDNTNPTKEDRAKYILAAKAHGYRVIGYYMQSILRECVKRNNLREGKECIPATAIAATSKKLQLPSLKEGFNELYFVENDGKTMNIREWRNEK